MDHVCAYNSTLSHIFPFLFRLKKSVCLILCFCHALAYVFTLQSTCMSVPDCNDRQKEEAQTSWWVEGVEFEPQRLYGSTQKTGGGWRWVEGRTRAMLLPPEFPVSFISYIFLFSLQKCCGSLVIKMSLAPTNWEDWFPWDAGGSVTGSAQHVRYFTTTLLVLPLFFSVNCDLL